MLITHEMDYALRIVRALRGGPLPAAAIARQEDMGQAVTYKMLKKLTAAGLLRSRSGPAGGYALARPCSELTLQDLFRAAGGSLLLSECMAPDHRCPRNAGGGCGPHRELCRIQQVLTQELQRRSLEDILAGP